MKNNKIYLLFIPFILLIFLTLYRQDNYQLTFTSDNFSTPGAPFGDVAQESPLLTMEAGTYRLSVSYSVDSEAFCMIYSESYVSSDNQPGVIFGEAKLSPETHNVELNFSIPDTIYDLKIGFSGISDPGNIDTVFISTDTAYYYDTVILAVIIILATLLTVYFAKSHKLTLNRKLLTFYFISIAFISTLPLMNDFIIDGHDLSFQLTRIDGIAEGLKDGQFPVRINTIFGNENGYISPMMYPELFLYIPALLRLCGMSVMNSYKLFVFLINLCTVCFSYFCFSKISKSKYVGIMGSALYTMGLYRLMNLYTRGALAEVLAMAFLPFILLGMYQVFWGDEKDYKWLTIGFTGVFGSHIVNTELSLIFCTAFGILSVKQLLQKQRLISLCKAAGLTLLLNLWFILPFLYYYRQDLYILSLNNPIEDYGVYFSQLFNTFISSDGLAIPKGTTVGEIATAAGSVLGLGILLFLLGRWILHKEYSENRTPLESISAFCFLFGIISLLVSSDLFPWDLVKRLPIVGSTLAAVQYPWRYMTMASLFLSLLGALSVFRFADQKKHRQILCTVTVFIAAAASLYYLDSCTQITPRMTSKYDRYDINCLYDGQYYYASTDDNMVFDRVRNVTSSVPMDISEFSKSGSRLSFDFSFDTDSADVWFEVPFFYYDGYEAVLDGETSLTVTRGENDILRILLPSGVTKGSIEVSYEGLWFFRIGDAVTLITLMSLGLWQLKPYLMKIFIRYKQ